MKRLGLFLYLLTFSAFGQSVIPAPAVIQPERGAFLLQPGLRVWAAPACSAERKLLQQYWQEAGLPSLTNASKSRLAEVQLLVDSARLDALGLEGYELIISSRRILVAGASPVGVFYGLQTLRQLLPQGGTTVQAVLIRDKPRFGWRSFRLFEGQQPQGLLAVKILVDELALLKFNRLYWHLPANEGQSSQGTYTREQIEQIRQYAQERYVTVVSLALSAGKLMEAGLEKSPLTDTSSVYFWKGTDRQMLDAARRGARLVTATCPQTCLTRPLTELPLDGVYRFEPIPDQMPEDLRLQILGVAYEYRGVENAVPEDLFLSLHPRLAAAAEVAWTFQQARDWSRFRQTLARFEKQWWGK